VRTPSQERDGERSSVDARPGRWPDRLGPPAFGVLTWSVLAGLLASFAWGADKGLSLGDESYYLLGYRFPHSSPPNDRQFKYMVDAITFHHPLTIAGYRLLGLAALLLGSLGLMLAFLTFLDRRLPRYRRALPATSSLCAFGATAGLLGLTWLPRTISYNTIAAVLTELAVAAVVLATSSTPGGSGRPASRELVLTVVAGALLAVLFFDKFPAAVLVGLLLVAFVPVVVGWRRAWPLIAALGAGGLVTLLVSTTDFIGGPFSVQGVRDGADIASRGTHNVGDIVSADVRNIGSVGLLSVGSVLFALAFAAPVIAGLAPSRLRFVVGWAMAVPGPIALILYLRSNWDHGPTRLYPAVFMVLGGVGLGLVLAWVTDRVVHGRREPRSDRRVLAAIAFLLIVLPLATSFGTNVGTFFLSLNSGAAFACVIALAWGMRGHVVASRWRETALSYAPLAAAVVVFSLLIVHGTVVRPFEVSTSLGGQSQAISGVRGLSHVDVDPETARVLNRLQTEVDAVSTFRPGDPIGAVARLGMGAGIAYALGGWLPGSEWWNDSAELCLVLDRVPDDMARTDVVIRSTRASSEVDDCLRRSLPGYPDEFDERATVDGFDHDQLEIFVRRP
jgi:hypothetical protein